MMSYPPNAKKASSSSKPRTNSSSSTAQGSRVPGVHGKKAGQMLSSTLSSSTGSSTTEMSCDVSKIEKPVVGNQRQCPKSQDKNRKTIVTKKEISQEEKNDIAYAASIQKLYLCSLQKEATQKVKTEMEICFSDLEAERLKLHNKISSIRQYLKVVSALQESEAGIEEIEKMFGKVADDMYQLQAMLKKVVQDMKIANSPVPLKVLKKVTDASRDEFLSIIQELSNIRNEIISIMKPCEVSQECAAQHLQSILSTVLELRDLAELCCSTLPSVVCDTFQALSLQACVTQQEQEFKASLT